MKKRSKIAFCLLIASLLLPLNVVFGSWSETDHTGTWENAYDYLWKTPDNETWHTATLDFSFGWITNFTEWKATITQESHGWGATIWDDDFECDSVFTLVDNASVTEVKITSWTRGEHIFFWTTEVSTMHVYVNGSEIAQYWEGGFMRHYFDAYQDGSKLMLSIRVFDMDWNCLRGDDFEIDVGLSWFENVTLTQMHDAWGKGWCLGTKTSEVIKSNESPEGTTTGIPTRQEEFWTRLWNSIRDLGSAIPEPIKSWFIQIQAWMDTFWLILTLVWTMVVAFLPVAGTFYFMSFIGVFFTGIVTGNMDLLQTYIMKQYELANSFANTIVTTIHAIWSLIKFW